MSDLIKSENDGRPVSQYLTETIDTSMSGDWAINENAYNTVRANLKALPELVAKTDQKALEAYRAQMLDGTFGVKIRNGVAIIPITGPIFRYYNWYIYYYGGTCLQFLARDFQSALDNPNVYAILFQINSPGGEVTGTNEFAKMVFRARKKKPMTTYVEGMMCSAALWSGTAAGDIVADETAQIGSIGVCTTYYDWTGYLDKLGIKEIFITSDQSPDKNLPPTTDKGLAQVKKRLTDICQIFGECVAANREVSIKTVWEKFGQGGVMIAAEAMKVGLIDRLGSFEETLDSLAKTHNPNYIPDTNVYDDEEEEPIEDQVDDDEAREKTLNLSEAAESLPVTESADTAEIKTPENIETIENHEPLEEALETNGELMNTQETKAAEAAAENTDQAGENKPVDMAEYNRVVAENARLTQEKADADQRVLDAQKETAKVNLTNRMAAVAANFKGNEEGAKTNFLVDLAEKFGEDSAQFKAYVTDQNAFANQKETAALFAEAGVSGNGSKTKSAEEQLDALAKTRMAADKCTYEVAYDKVLQENKPLYAQYEQEQAA